LQKIESGLRSDRKLVEAARIGLYKNIVRAIASNTHSGNTNRRSVQYALDKGIELVKKYGKYLSKDSPRFLMKASFNEQDDEPEDLDRDDLLDEEIDEDDLPSEEDKEENLTTLQSIRKRLVDLRDRLRAGRKNLRARIVETHIRAVDAVIVRLRAGRLENSRLVSFLDRVRSLLDRFAERNREVLFSAYSADDGEMDDIKNTLDEEPEDLDNEEIEDEADENDLPDEKEENENRTALQRIRQQLVDLRDRLRSRRRGFRVRVVETYIRVVDVLLARLNARNLDNTRFADFVKRVKKLLEKYADSNRD